MSSKRATIGIAGTGAIGRSVAKALEAGIDGYDLIAASDLNPSDEINVPYMEFDELAEKCDLIIEALPPKIVPSLTAEVFSRNKNLILISSCALLLYPEILVQHKRSNSRILVPSGALAGIDGVAALAQIGIKTARIASTKHPRGFVGAPYIIENSIDLESITEKTQLFSGHALEAAKAFPENVNVAATLSLAGIGPENTQVEVWAHPQAVGNTHEIEVVGEFSTITAKIENTPDPANPKSSMLAAQSIISILKRMSEPLVTL